MANYYIVGMKAYVNLYLVAEDDDEARTLAERIAERHSTYVLQSVVPDFPVLAQVNVDESEVYDPELVESDTQLEQDRADIEEWLNRRFPGM